MSETLKTRVLIENVGGAGGTRGAGQVAKAAPDGYTLLLHNVGQATSTTLYRRLPFNALSDFETIGLVTDVPMTLIGRADLEPNTLKELLALLKAKGPTINFGHAGVGSAAHLCSLLLMSAADVQVTNIPYQEALNRCETLLPDRLILDVIKRLIRVAKLSRDKSRFSRSRRFRD